MSRAGTLFIIGTGPGPAELLTLRAAQLIRETGTLAFFSRKGSAGNARSTVAPLLRPGIRELRFTYPYTTEISCHAEHYRSSLRAFYDQCAHDLDQILSEGEDVVLLCEGDPFFYGSVMYVFDRLRGRHEIDITPGIMAMNGCWSAAQAPIVHGDDVFCVLPGTLPQAELARHINRSQAAVIMKVGRNLARIRAALQACGRLDDALYVERGTQAGQKIMPLNNIDLAEAPYFSLILLPGRKACR